MTVFDPKEPHATFTSPKKARSGGERESAHGAKERFFKCPRARAGPARGRGPACPRFWFSSSGPGRGGRRGKKEKLFFVRCEVDEVFAGCWGRRKTCFFLRLAARTKCHSSVLPFLTHLSFLLTPILHLSPPSKPLRFAHPRLPSNPFLYRTQPNPVFSFHFSETAKSILTGKSPSSAAGFFKLKSRASFSEHVGGGGRAGRRRDWEMVFGIYLANARKLQQIAR